VSQVLVNADDFGLTSGVNRAIAELHKAGLVTSTTLMARAGATDEAIATARATPSLGVGCHVVLVDGEPVLPPQQIPSLIDAKRVSSSLRSLSSSCVSWLVACRPLKLRLKQARKSGFSRPADCA